MFTHRGTVLFLTAACLFSVTDQATSQKSTDPAKVANFRGRIVAMAADGRSITLESDRNPTTGEVTKTEIKLTDKTKVELMGNGFLGTEKVELKVGYYALVWLVEGSKDTARGIRANLRSPSVFGKITAVSDDGKTVTIESKPKGGEATKTDITLNDKTRIEYYGIDKDEDKKLKADYDAIVWFQKNKKNVVEWMKVGVRKEK